MANILDEFFTDLDNLYLWMDEIYQVDCVSKCNVCCKRDVIWMLTPELVRLNALAKPKKVKNGCPFQTRNGCSVHPYRPLVCRSFGAPQLLSNPAALRMLEVKIGSNRQILAGPGVCTEFIPPSRCDIAELNKIYECYLVLAKQWGLVAIGSCDNADLQLSQERIFDAIQPHETRHKIYARNGIPTLYEEQISLYKNYIPQRRLK